MKGEIKDSNLHQLKSGMVIRLYRADARKPQEDMVLLWKSDGLWAMVPVGKYKGDPDLHIKDRKLTRIDQWDLSAYAAKVIKEAMNEVTYKGKTAKQGDFVKVIYGKVDARMGDVTMDKGDEFEVIKVLRNGNLELSPVGKYRSKYDDEYVVATPTNLAVTKRAKNEAISHKVRNYYKMIMSDPSAFGIPRKGGRYGPIGIFKRSGDIVDPETGEIYFDKEQLIAPDDLLNDVVELPPGVRLKPIFLKEDYKELNRAEALIEQVIWSTL